MVMPGGAEGEALRLEAYTLERAEGLVQRGHRMLDLDKLERVGPYVLHMDSGEVWLFAESELPAAASANARGPVATGE